MGDRPQRLDAAAAAVLRRPARARRRGRRGGRARRSSTSAAATPTSGRRRTSSRRCASRCAATRRARLLADPRSRRARRRRSPAATATSTASSSTRSARLRSCPGRRPRSSSWRWRSPTTATRSCCPTRTTPTTRRGSPSPARGCRRCRSSRTTGWAPDLDAAPRRGRALPQLPVEPVRGLRARRAPSTPRFAWAERTGGHVVHDAAYVDLVFDGRRPESFLATPGAKDVGVEMWSMSKTYGMAGWRIGFVRRQRRGRRARSTCSTTTAASASSRPLQAAAIAALEGPQDSVADRVATYQRRRDRLAAALPVPIVCEGTFYVWLRLPEGLTAERLLVEQRVAVAPGEGFGPSGAGWARLSLAVDRRCDRRGARAARARLRGRASREDRHRRAVLVVVLGRRRRARRAPGRRAAPARSRREDPDGQRPARAGSLGCCIPARGRHGELPDGDHPGRPLGRRAGERLAPEHRALAALDRPHPPRAASTSNSTSSTCTSR